MRTIEFKITDEDGGTLIRDYLRGFGVFSSLLKRLKQSENGITVNGEFAKTNQPLKADDTLKISIENRGSMPEPFEMNTVKKIYDDEDLLILDKPPYMSVHESRNHRGDTLANAASIYMESDTAFRAVYRLDRDTSGLVVIAKNELSACKLAGKIKKDYYAVCKGILHGEGTIDLPIRRAEESIITRGVFDDGEKAVTHWQAVENFRNKTLLKINLEMGKTHQIRVHFSHIGHPLLSDTLYGDGDGEISRQALHCKKVYFTHPITSKEITAECDFPDDFKNILKD